MYSLKNRVTVGFYLSLFGSVAIILVMVAWNTLYISGTASLEEKWNAAFKGGIAERFMNSDPKNSLNSAEIRALLDRTERLPFVSHAKFEKLKNAVISFETDDSNENFMKVIRVFNSLIKEAKKNAVDFLICSIVLVVLFNSAVHILFVFRPQRAFLRFLNLVSDDLSGLNVDHVQEDRISKFKELDKLTYSFNKLGERLEISGTMLKAAERSKTLEELTEELYVDLKKFFKFNRIAFASVKDGFLKTEITYSDSREIFLKPPFEQRFSEDIFDSVIKKGEPRIIADHERYLEEHPDSEDTRLILKEGMKSSVTIPIFVGEVCLGFLFLNSFEKNSFTREDTRKLEFLGEFISTAYQKTTLTRDIVMSAVMGFNMLVEKKDGENEKHTVRVAHYSKALAEELMKLNASGTVNHRYVEELFEQSRLHDIGKAAIPDRLLKSEELDPEEYELVKTHTVVGHRILSDVDKKLGRYDKSFFGMGSSIALSHHERWNGTGYPNDLKGYEIPLCSRIVAVADVFDTLNSKKRYETSFEYEKAVNAIVNASNSLFDPDVVYAFVKSRERIREIHNRFIDSA